MSFSYKLFIIYYCFIISTNDINTTTPCANDTVIDLTVNILKRKLDIQSNLGNVRKKRIMSEEHKAKIAISQSKRRAIIHDSNKAIESSDA